MDTKMVIVEFTKGTTSISETIFQPNSVVIARTNQYGAFRDAVNFGHVKNTKTISLYMEIIKAALVEDEVGKQILNGCDRYDYLEALKDSVRFVKGVKAPTNQIVSRLNTQSIFRTGSDGKITGAAISSDLKFKDTFLNIKNCAGLVNKYYQYCAGQISEKELTNDIYFFAKKVELQTNYLKNVNERLSALTAFLEKVDGKQKGKKVTTKTTKKKVAA